MRWFGLLLGDAFFGDVLVSFLGELFAELPVDLGVFSLSFSKYLLFVSGATLLLLGAASEDLSEAGLLLGACR